MSEHCMNSYTSLVSSVCICCINYQVYVRILLSSCFSMSFFVFLKLETLSFAIPYSTTCFHSSSCRFTISKTSSYISVPLCFFALVRSGHPLNVFIVTYLSLNLRCTQFSQPGFPLMCNAASHACMLFTWKQNRLADI